MAIEILKHGADPRDKSYEAECYKCHSVLKWHRSDAKTDYSGDQREGPFTQIECPVCKNYVTGYP